MYCGNCFRDNALVAALRRMGHPTLMIPLYLPLTLDEEDQSADTPVFFGGVSVYLEQKSALFRHAPRWLHRLLASPALLRWAGGRAAKTRAADVGDLMLSTLRGEEGKQACELEALVGWLRQVERPEVICLSNVLLIGLARRLKRDVGCAVACMMQGEDTFLDALPDSHRERCWQVLRKRAAEVDLFVTPSRYFGELMGGRLGLGTGRVRVVPNGIALEGYGEVQGAGCRVQSEKGEGQSDDPPTVGYFARMCREKGLDMLVGAYILLRQRNRVKALKLKVGGGCGPSDEPFVESLRERLRAAGVLGEVEFCPNLDRAGKLAFLRSLTVFSVPALYGEAFGLYAIEALAAGVPIVQPHTAAFPELVEATGGGVLCDPGSAESLADRLEQVLLEPGRAQALGELGRRAVFEKFSAERMARDMVGAFEEARQLLGAAVR
jgi:glycosyltransferase involved in cell wall biosynthesis